jgi:hypothetical protein
LRPKRQIFPVQHCSSTIYYYLKLIGRHHHDGKEDMMEADERHGVVVATVWSSWLKKFEENMSARQSKNWGIGG